MNYLGIDYDVKNMPVLDEGFIPFGVWMKAYLEGAEHPIAVAVEREDGLISVRESAIRGGEFAEADFRYVERLVKFELWSIGGFRVYLRGCDDIAAKLAEAYSPEGARSFDYGFVGDVYEKPLEVMACTEADFPAANEAAKKIGGHMEGCRIGFDAGGSDRKVSAVIDGESVYSEEVVWFPKVTEDPEYHFNEIVTAFKTAASKMPRVDAIGVSSAGTFVGNSPMVASLFIKVPRERRDEVKSIYDRAGKEIGDVPLVVANDGDVTALAGFMSTGKGDILGIAMGTSEAVGYVNDEGNVLGWINELAFAPVDLSPDGHAGRVVRRLRRGLQVLQPGRRHQAGSGRRHRARPGDSPPPRSSRWCRAWPTRATRARSTSSAPSACTWRTRSCCTARSTRSRRCWCWAAWPPAWAATS